MATARSHSEPDKEGRGAIASWYMEGPSDGLGDRLHMFDNSSTPSLELLRFHREIASAPGFEEALRARVVGLDAFRHRGFPTVRAVERLNGMDLALVSTFTAGKRISEFLRLSRTRKGLHPSFAAWLAHRVTSHVADLQRHVGGIAHGAISGDRIVLTADGRLVVTEHALGPALAKVRLWLPDASRRFGTVTLAEDAAAGNCADGRDDAIQIGAVVLALLSGREVEPVVSRTNLATLIEEARIASTPRAPALTAALCRWLARALQVAPDPFGSAIEAATALDDFGGYDGPHAVLEPDDGGTNGRREVMYLGVERENPIDEPTPPWRADSIAAEPRVVERRWRLIGADREPVPSGADAAAAVASDRKEVQPAHRRFAPAVAAAAIVVALVEGLLLVRVGVGFGRAPVAPAPLRITITSAVPGESVAVDGRAVGVTPLSLPLTAAVRTIHFEPDHSVDAFTVLNASSSAPTGTMAATLPEPKERRGGFRIAAPIEIQVLDGDHVLGSSSDGPIVATAGRHEFEFINTAVGYRTRQVVDVKPGQVDRVTVTPPPGRLSVNAAPWAQVAIDGSSVGDTPLANLPVAIGEHEVTFHNPQLGDRSEKVTVRADGLTRVSASFAK